MKPSKMAEFMLPEDYNKSIPHVYFLWNALDAVVYVGQSFNLKNRIQVHISEKLKLFCRVSLIECTADNVSEIEIENIRRLKPEYNRKENPDYVKKDIVSPGKSTELRSIVRSAAKEQGVLGVMELNELCINLTYERVSKVWHGNTSAKFCDVEYVLSVLKITVRWSK